METCAVDAISFNVLDNPPLVGSRMTCTSGTPDNRFSTISTKEAVSLFTVVSNPKLSRVDKIHIPCAPICPETITTSPGCAFKGEI